MRKTIHLLLVILSLFSLSACRSTPKDAMQSSVITRTEEHGSTSQKPSESDTSSKTEKPESVVSNQSIGNKPSVEIPDSSVSDGNETKPDSTKLLAEENARHDAVIGDLESKKSSTADYYDRKIAPLKGMNSDQNIKQYTDKKTQLEGQKATLKEELEKYQSSTRPEDAIAAKMLKDDLADIEKQLKAVEILLKPYEQIIELENEKSNALALIDLEIEKENELYQNNLKNIFK